MSNHGPEKGSTESHQVPVEYKLMINVIQKNAMPQGLCRGEFDLFGITHPSPVAIIEKSISTDEVHKYCFHLPKLSTNRMATGRQTIFLQFHTT